MLKTSPRPLTPRSRDPRAFALAALPSGASRLRRRAFISALIAGGVVLAGASCKPDEEPPLKGVTIPEIRAGEDIFAYITRVRGGFDQNFYKAIIGAANEYKEGDEALGIHALDQTTRDNARALLGNTKIADLRARPIYEDAVFDLIEGVLDDSVTKTLEPWTMAELRDHLLAADEPAIQAIIPGLPSDIIGLVVKLMTNDQLIAVGQKVFTALPGSKIGAKGYMGARIQPNSPTDNVDDIAWQVFSGWSYAVGDVVLGTNPVSSEVDSVAAVELVAQGHHRRLRPRRDDPPLRALPHRRAGRRRGQVPRLHRAVVPEPRLHRRRQRHLRRHRRGHARPRRRPRGQVRPVL
jgi:ethanolamine ammonia-lyase large subunit